VRLGRNLDVEIGNSLGNLLEFFSGRGSEKFKGDVVLDSPLFEDRQECESIVSARLKYVTDDHDRSVEMINAGKNVFCQQLRRAISGSSAACHSLESIGRSAACVTVMDTSSTREDCRYRIGEPVKKGFIPKGVQVTGHLFHGMTIIDSNVVEIVGDVGERIDASFPVAIPPGEIGNFAEVAPVSEDIQELAERLLG